MMRRSLLPMLAAVFAVGCADLPTAALLEPTDASFERAPVPDYPPPPFAIVDGGGTVNSEPFQFTAHFFANKPGNVAWLQFKSSTTANTTFSANARIMSANGRVSGTGTITVNGSTVNLSDVTTFNYQNYRTGGGVSFGGRGEAFGGYAPTTGGEVICCDVSTGDNR